MLTATEVLNHARMIGVRGRILKTTKTGRQLREYVINGISYKILAFIHEHA